MKYASIALMCLLGFAYAQDEEEKPPEQPAEEGTAEEEGGDAKPEPPPAAPADPNKVISDLVLANAAEDVPRIDAAAKEALRWAMGAKDEALAVTMAEQLTDSLKAAKGNWGTLTVVVQALGELRTKEGAKTLKKLAFKKKSKDEQEEKLQAAALVGLGKFADPREISGFEDASKSESKLIAKSAYEALAFYGSAKAKVRKQAAEMLMKRLEMEYPSSGGQGGKSVSAEKQERWNEVQGVMVAAMKALCREPTINDVENWREWWKENKKKSWKDDDES